MDSGGQGWLVRGWCAAGAAACPTQIRLRSDSDSIQIRFRPESDSIQIRFKTDPDPTEIRFRSDSDSIQIRFRFDSDSIQIRLKSDSDSTQIRPRIRQNPLRIENVHHSHAKPSKLNKMRTTPTRNASDPSAPTPTQALRNGMTFGPLPIFDCKTQ